MPFQLSPGVAVVEKDFTSIVPAVSTAAGAFAGVFQWGPVLQPVTISSENLLLIMQTHFSQQQTFYLIQTTF